MNKYTLVILAAASFITWCVPADAASKDDDILCFWAGPIASQYKFEHNGRSIAPGLELTAMHCKLPFVGMLLKSQGSEGQRVDTFGLQLTGGWVGLEFARTKESAGGRWGGHFMPYASIFPSDSKTDSSKNQVYLFYVGPTFYFHESDVHISLTVGLKFPIYGDLHIFDARLGCEVNPSEDRPPTTLLSDRYRH